MTKGGVALWLPPDERKVIPAKEVLKFAWNAKSDIGGVKGFSDYMKKASSYEKEKFNCPHWMLMYAAIDPEIQSKALGQFLAEPVIEWYGLSPLFQTFCSRADANAQDCVAFTPQERNLNFLMKLGFEVVGQTTIQEVNLWVTKRKPHAK